MSPVPFCSVIIPTRNRSSALRACLAALASQDLQAPFEVIVIDDGSEPSSAAENTALVGSCGLECSCISLPESLGPGLAREVGIRQARAALLCFTDDDCRPSPSWLRELTGALTASGADLAGGSLVLSCERGWGSRQLNAYLARHPVIPAPVQAGLFSPFRTPVTANLAVKKAAWLSAGGCPPACSRLADDVSVYYRLISRGASVVIAPKALVQHLFSGSALAIPLQRGWKYGQADALALQTCFPQSLTLAVLLPWCSPWQKTLTCRLLKHGGYVSLDFAKLSAAALLALAPAAMSAIHVWPIGASIGLTALPLACLLVPNASIGLCWKGLFSAAILCGRVRGSARHRNICL